LENAMANKDTVEFRLFESDLVTVGGILPAASMDLFLQLNEPGSGNIKIPMKSRAAGIVASGGFTEGKYRGVVRGGFFVENIDKPQATSAENAALMSISGRGALALLDDGIVWDDGTSATTRNLTGTKAGMLIALILEAKARGTLSNLTYNFTAVLDSVGVAWADDESLGWNVGTSLLDVARQITKRGIDFDITPSGTGSFVLSAYKNGKGTDKSNTVYFRVGVNCEEVSSLEAGGDVRNALRISYKAGFTGVSDSASIALRRRREKLLDARNAQTSESALTYGSADLAMKKNPKTSITVKVYDGKGPRAFLDYDLGDTITLDVKGVQASYRVRGMQLNWNGRKFADVTVDLNSIIDENEIRLSQDVDWLLDEWETARDANLMATSFWAAIGNADDVITEINCMHAIGDKVYFGGIFTRIGGVNITNNIAVYDVSQKKWSPLPGGSIFSGGVLLGVYSITSHGSKIYFCGWMTGAVQQYDTSTGVWSSLDGGLIANEFIALGRTVLVIDDNLYVSGYFDASLSGVGLGHIARWDITAQTWHGMGEVYSPSAGSSGTEVVTMAAIGSDLYVGGLLASAGGVAVNRVAKWNGSVWSALGAGLDGTCYALAVLDTKIAAGGGFTGRISAWDGSAWTIIDGGLNGICRGLAVYLTDIYAVGDFTQANGISANYIAKYNGGGWTTLEKGLNNKGYAIALIDDDVYVAGLFTTAGNKKAIKVAAYISNFESLANYLEKTGDEFDLGAAIHNAPASAITDADEIPFWEDVSNALRKITWANIKTTLQTFFDTLYLSAVATDATLTGDGTVANPLSAVGGGGGTPGGVSGEIQYNNAGAFGGLSSFYYDPTLGIVYLGGAGGMSAELNSASLLNLLAKVDDQQVLQTMWTWGATSTTVPTLAGFRSRGTKASPSALMSGDRLFSLAGFGHDGVGYVGSLARILYKTTEDLSATNHGAGIYFEGTPNGSTVREEIAKITSAGIDIPTGKQYLVNGVPLALSTEPLQRLAML
jgi:hypothetical protein